jgi:hypothetical protein
MIRDLDHEAEALAAMRRAMTATCPIEREKWLRVALAWKDLAGGAIVRMRRDEVHREPASGSAKAVGDIRGLVLGRRPATANPGGAFPQAQHR